MLNRWILRLTFHCVKYRKFIWRILNTYIHHSRRLVSRKLFFCDEGTTRDNSRDCSMMNEKRWLRKIVILLCFKALMIRLSELFMRTWNENAFVMKSSLNFEWKRFYGWNFIWDNFNVVKSNLCRLCCLQCVLDKKNERSLICNDFVLPWKILRNHLTTKSSEDHLVHHTKVQ